VDPNQERDAIRLDRLCAVSTPSRLSEATTDHQTCARQRTDDKDECAYGRKRQATRKRKEFDRTMHEDDIFLWPDGFWCVREKHRPESLREDNYREIAHSTDEWLGLISSLPMPASAG